MSTTPSDITTPTLGDGGEDPEIPGRGASIGRFLVLAPLGMGAMGMVLSAYDPQLERKVALKLLRSDVWRGELSDVGRERLVREAQAMARLSHPNVVAVYEAVFSESTGYLVMEQVEGTTLKAWLQKQPRRWQEIVDTLVAAGEGLAAAHRAGLVHHDFKPENVLVDRDGRPRVSDFGLAGAGTPGAGTRSYMAPEQHGDGGTIDARADVYAFCVTLWEALAGERPAPGTPVPSSRKAPRWVYRALSRGLAAAPDDRWPSMDALLAALRRGRSTRARAAAVAAAIVIVGALAFTVGRQRSVASFCEGGEARLAGVWDDARKAAVGGAFAATGLPFAGAAWTGASARIDDYARGWVDMYGEACRATRVEGRQSDTLLDLRMGCLERRRALLGALTDLWGRGMDTAAVEAAVDAAARLPALAECADARGLTARSPEPGDAALASRVAAARRSVDAASALQLSGRLADAKKAAAAARVEAEATGWAPAKAEASRAEGDVLAGLQEPAAEPRLLEAARWAWTAHDDRAAASALVRLATHLGEIRNQRALFAASIAQAAVARVDADEDLRLELLIARSAAHAGAEELDAAKETLLAARASSSHGPLHPLTVRIIGGLATVYHRLRDTKTARPLAEQALEAEIATYGPDHPKVASRLASLAAILADQGEFATSAGHYRRALAILEKVGAPDTALTANALNGLGIAEDEQGHYAEAAELMKRGLAIRERLFGPESEQVAQITHNLAVNHRLQGRYDESLAYFARVLAIRTKLSGPEHALVARVLWPTGWVYENQGDAATALDYFRRSLVIREKALGPDHEQTHQSRAYTAWALATLGRCAEARPLLAVAIPGLEKMNLKSRHLFWALMAQARCDLADGRASAAVPAFERAIAIDETPRQGVFRGIARAWLARAQWAAGQHELARASARQAETDLIGRAEGARELSALRAWRAAHGR